MQVLAVSALLALFATSASSEAIAARQTTNNIISLVYITVSPDGQVYSYPDVNITVPVDGSTVKIDTTETIYSILSSEAESVDCALLGASGQVTHIETEIIDADGPQQFVAVTCCPIAEGLCPTPILSSSASSSAVVSSTASALSSSSTPVTSSAVGTGVGFYPSYPTGTAPGVVIGAAGTTASTGSVATGTGVVYKGTGSPVPFTGDAIRAVKSVGGSLFALIGLVFAL